MLILSFIFNYLQLHPGSNTIDLRAIGLAKEGVEVTTKSGKAKTGSDHPLMADRVRSQAISLPTDN